jgi:hypothetical protein
MDLKQGLAAHAGPAAARADDRSSGCGDLDFRRLLHELTEHTPASLHRHSVLALAAGQPGAHIRVLDGSFSLPQPLFNCVMYALDLVGRFEPQLQRLQGLEFRFLADTAFLQRALERRLLRDELSPLTAMPGDLVLYFDQPAPGQAGPARPRHVGKYLGPNRVASKWGPGELYVHGLWDLPLSLGRRVRYFAAPEHDAVLDFVGTALPQVRLRPALPAGAAAPAQPRQPQQQAATALH